MGYPGEVVKYRTTAGNKGGFQGPGEDITGTSGDYVGFSNFRMRVDGGATRDAGPFNMQYNAQRCRVVGNEIGPWVAGDSAVLNCAGVTGEGNFFEILGNHIHDIEGTSAQQNHGVYPGTNSYGWTIAYNWIENCMGGSHLNFNDSDGGTGTFQTPFGVWMGFTNISIHHNWMENAAKYGVSFNDVGAQQGQLDARIFCNMIIGTGLPPFHTGTTTATSDVVVAFNTIYNCNTLPNGGNAMMRNDGWQHLPDHSWKFIDNIFAFGPNTAAGTAWLNDTSGFSSGISWSRNLYFVNGDTTAPAPTMDSLAVVGDPKFTNPAGGDFSLQPSSPAINSGTQPLPAGMTVGDDYTGQMSRTAGGAPDLGCFEYAQPTPYVITPPTATGGPQIGVLTAITIGTWANSPSGYARQIKLDGTPYGSSVSGTGVLNFTGAVGDERKVLSCTFTATNAAGSTSYTLTIGPVATGAGAPVNTAAPVITGTAQVGATLSVSPGTWTGGDGTFGYQWFDAGVAIPGATSSTYTLQAGDLGLMVTAQVIANDPVNGSQVATSAAVGPVASAPANPVTFQTVAHALAASTNTDFAMTSSVANGSLMLAFLAEWDNAPFNTHYSDIQGHVSADFTRTTAVLYGSNPWAGWAYVKATASGAYTMTLNPDSGQGGAAVVSEIRGIDPTSIQDIPPDTASGNTATVTVTASAPSTKSNNLVRVGIAVVGTGHTLTADDPTAWQLVDHAQGPFNSAWVFERKLSAIETSVFHGTLDADTGWIGQTVNLKGGI